MRAMSEPKACRYCEITARKHDGAYGPQNRRWLKLRRDPDGCYTCGDCRSEGEADGRASAPYDER